MNTGTVPDDDQRDRRNARACPRMYTRLSYQRGEIMRSRTSAQSHARHKIGRSKRGRFGISVKFKQFGSYGKYCLLREADVYAHT